MVTLGMQNTLWGFRVCPALILSDACSWDIESQPSREMSLQLPSHDAKVTEAVPPTSSFVKILPIHPHTVEFLLWAWEDPRLCDTE